MIITIGEAPLGHDPITGWINLTVLTMTFTMLDIEVDSHSPAATEVTETYATATCTETAL